MMCYPNKCRHMAQNWILIELPLSFAYIYIYVCVCVCVCVCGDQLPLEVLFSLDRLGLWPNDPVQERGHVRGRLTKVEMEVA